MISENKVVAIAKAHMGNLAGASEADASFASIPQENVHVDTVLFAEPDQSVPAKFAAYMREYQALCQLLDCVPEDAERLTNEAFGRSLHGQYKFVLEACAVPPTLPDSTDAARLQEATDFLYRGDNEPSEAYRRYIQFLEEIHSLKAQLLADAIAAGELDPAERSAWEAEGKTFLEQRIKLLEQRLLVEGRKEEVERHLRTYESLQQKHPAVVVEELKRRIGELEQLHGLSPAAGATYLPVQPSPALHQIGIWQHATIPEQELRRLQKQIAAADPSFKLEPDLKQVDFEWCSVYIARNWFDSSFFTMPWTLPGGQQVSRGERPNAGMLQAYVKRVVLCRKLSFKLLVDKPPRVSGTGVLIPPKPKPKPRHPLVRPTLPKPRPRFRPEIRLEPMTPSVRPVGPSLESARIPAIDPAMLARHKLVSRSLSIPAAGTGTPALKKLSKPQIMATAAVVNKSMLLAVPQNQTNLKAYLTKRSFAGKMQGTLRTQPAGKQLAHRKITMENPLILVFECKRVPRCPNG